MNVSRLALPLAYLACYSAARVFLDGSARQTYRNFSSLEVYDGDVFLSRHAVQSGAQILHLLAVQTAQGNLDGLLGVQLWKVGKNIRHRFAMFSFATLRNLRPIHRRIIRYRFRYVPSVCLPLSEIVSVCAKSYRKESYPATKNLCES